MQLNVYEGRESVATGQVASGPGRRPHFEMEAGSISREAVRAIDEQLSLGEDWGEVRDGGRELTWKTARQEE
jgi:hypothetical protein